jgi:hypothetical protein
MRIRRLVLTGLLVGALATLGTGADAVAESDPAHGFVAKGDVQQALGWNNKQIQSEPIVFAVSPTVRTWECRNSADQAVTVSEPLLVPTQLMKVDFRVKNQITGFQLNGYSWVRFSPPCAAGSTYVAGTLHTTATSTSVVTANGVPVPVS